MINKSIFRKSTSESVENGYNNGQKLPAHGKFATISLIYYLKEISNKAIY